MALEVATIVADRLTPGVDVGALAIEIMRADLWPHDDKPTQAALLVLLVLFGASPATAVDTIQMIGTLVDDRDVKALPFVTGMVRSLATLSPDGFPPSLAIASTVTAEMGDGPALTVRCFCDDGVESVSFTNDPHGYRPDRDGAMGIGLTVPGRQLFYIGRDISDLDPPIEYRSFPFEVSA